LKSTFRRIELRGLDGYLAYTTSGSHSLRKAGVSAARIAIVHNTIDVEHQGALHASAKAEGEAALRACLGLPAGVPVLVFLGRHIRDKCIDLLVDYARRSTSVGRDLRVLVFGEGPEKPALIARAQGLDSIAFLPPDDLQQARALALAAAVVIPGFSGLAIPHAFAHHVPFLTREGIVHPPEIDYLRNGGNGLLLPHAPEAFFAALDKYLDDAPLQARLARGAAETAAGLSMDAMAAAYDGLVRRLLEARGRMPQSAASAVSSPAPGSAA
jgi:glycosyltransferase involved in cell wall biosynthesis